MDSHARIQHCDVHCTPHSVSIFFLSFFISCNFTFLPYELLVKNEKKLTTYNLHGFFLYIRYTIYLVSIEMFCWSIFVGRKPFFTFFLLSSKKLKIFKLNKMIYFFTLWSAPSVNVLLLKQKSILNIKEV